MGSHEKNAVWYNHTAKTNLPSRLGTAKRSIPRCWLQEQQFYPGAAWFLWDCFNYFRLDKLIKLQSREVRRRTIQQQSTTSKNSQITMKKFTFILTIIALLICVALGELVCFGISLRWELGELFYWELLARSVHIFAHSFINFALSPVLKQTRCIWRSNSWWWCEYYIVWLKI